MSINPSISKSRKQSVPVISKDALNELVEMSQVAELDVSRSSNGTQELYDTTDFTMESHKNDIQQRISDVKNISDSILETFREGLTTLYEGVISSREPIKTGAVNIYEVMPHLLDNGSTERKREVIPFSCLATVKLNMHVPDSEHYFVPVLFYTHPKINKIRETLNKKEPEQIISFLNKLLMERDSKAKIPEEAFVTAKIFSCFEKSSDGRVHLHFLIYCAFNNEKERLVVVDFEKGGVSNKYTMGGKKLWNDFLELEESEGAIYTNYSPHSDNQINIINYMAKGMYKEATQCVAWKKT